MLHFNDQGARGAHRRTFKTAWFAKVARKARIPDKDLCTAVENLEKGQADAAELRDFRRLAEAYRQLTDQQLARLLADGDLTEICDEDKKEVQE